MQAQIREMEPLLKAKSASTDKLMESLVKEKAAADEVRLVVVADESAAKVCFVLFIEMFITFFEY